MTRSFGRSPRPRAGPPRSAVPVSELEMRCSATPRSIHGNRDLDRREQRAAAASSAGADAARFAPPRSAAEERRDPGPREDERRRAELAHRDLDQEVRESPRSRTSRRRASTRACSCHDPTDPVAAWACTIPARADQLRESSPPHSGIGCRRAGNGRRALALPGEVAARRGARRSRAGAARRRRRPALRGDRPERKARQRQDDRRASGDWTGSSS